jgi:hypothetical protein
MIFHFGNVQFSKRLRNFTITEKIFSKTKKVKESKKNKRVLLKMRHLYRNTASGAEAAGCAHGAHGAHSGVHTPDVSCFSISCFTPTVHVSRKSKSKVI